MKAAEATAQMISPARTTAFDILLRVEREESYATELLHSSRLDDLSVADRALCTQIVMGVLRWRSRLDSVVAPLVSQPIARLDLEVLMALRIGAFQFAFLDRVPDHAVVNESVELVKRARKQSAMGLVNAVLRKLADNPALIQPAAIATAVTHEKMVADLAELYAHPLWLVQRWAASFGKEAAGRICAYDQAEPRAAIRMRDASVEDELSAQGIELQPGVLLRSARRVVSGDITATRAFAERRVGIQDGGSQLIAALAGRGERILDCCAAPGGKTAILSALNPQSTIIAAELHPHRAQLMRRLLAGATNVQVIAADAEALPLREEFDRVLVDVPCSGTGTLARNPEIKWRLAKEDLTELPRRQVAILRSALARLSLGGRLVYSTCSLEPEENQFVVNEVLEGNAGFRLRHCRLELERLRDEGELAWPSLGSLLDGPFLRILPGVHPCDGFFAAIIERNPK